jgi:hypothetical protein
MVDTYRFGEGSAPTTLTGMHEILLDDGAVVTVMDVLCEPERFDGATCADPLEWDYGGGRNKAIIYTDRSRPAIFSQAHGGQWFDLRLTSGDLQASSIITERPMLPQRDKLEQAFNLVGLTEFDGP